MGFSFNTIAKTSVVATDKPLRPYSINKVTFVNAKRDVLHSDKNGGADYKVFKIRFEGENGYYEEKFFLPSTSGRDVERTDNQWGGKNPSSADRAMMFFAHVVGVLNPEGFETLKTYTESGKIQNFDQLAELSAKILSKVEGKECYLKLVGRTTDKGTFACIPPFFCGIYNDVPKIKTNFLSLEENVLSFEPREDKARQEFENRKPTPMPDDTVNTPVENTSTNDDDDLDVNEMMKALG